MYDSRTHRTNKRELDRTETIIENAVLLFVDIKKRLHKMWL